MCIHSIPAGPFYAQMRERLERVRSACDGRPLTLSEKILSLHLSDPTESLPRRRGESYALFHPDRVAMQDATAQMAMLQLMSAPASEVAVPTSVHLDHLICAHQGAGEDLQKALRDNAEVYHFLEGAAKKYGIDFWPAGAGIIHQVVLENYSMPGAMMVGTDSHTPNAGGMGMIAVGVGGADAVDVMVGQSWELKVPRIIGVRLKGSLHAWAAPKDIALRLLSKLSVKGATNCIIEYFGPGVESLSLTGRSTICNLGAEMGATTSIFPFDRRSEEYLRQMGRAGVAEEAAQLSFRADPEVEQNPESFYDKLIEIDLDTLHPQLSGPFTPDAITPVSEMSAKVAEAGYPDRVEVCLIGSCTNSSYEDLSRAAAVAKSALSSGLKPKAQLIVNPGSERIRAIAERDGILGELRRAGAIVMTNACGPCIGQWKRVHFGGLSEDEARGKRNSIITTFNRNFARRADGNPNTFAFITSPQMALAYTFSGSLSFDPSRDTILSDDGRQVSLSAPEGREFPEGGFLNPTRQEETLVSDTEPLIKEGSERLQELHPFPKWDGKDFADIELLIKVKGKCTTDHISPAGPWLRFRGHLENISHNMLLGATNAFLPQTGRAEILTASGIREMMEVWRAAAYYRDHEDGSMIVAEENYGEGSSREHAAMEPRFLGVKVVLAKSFARIHETNLKKQGVLALTFADPADYERVRLGDKFCVHCSTIEPGRPIMVDILHSDGSREIIRTIHTYNQQQITWLRAGSALNALTK